MTWNIINGNNTEVLKQYPDNSFDCVVTDPPYGISFLGKDWDSKKATETTSKLTALHNLPSGMKHTSLADDLEFQKWMSEVFAECWRVLKPGGHLLAFSAARTYHHMAMAAQFAGFEIRDQIMWIYGSGFPKSQDVGKAMDRRAGKADSKTSLLQAKEILKNLYNNSGKTHTQINSECGFNATGYLATEGKHKGWAQNLPLNEKWQKIKQVVGCDDTYDYLFTSVERDVIGTKKSGCFSDEDRHTIGASETQTVDITIPKSNSARQWDGWGTQLKPAHEPIVMARKPIKNTVMDNVQEYGTGAINIDATRVGDEVFDTSLNRRSTQNNQIYDGGWQGKEGGELVQGRFPANVIHDGSLEVVSLFPSTESKNNPPKMYSNKTGFREGYVNGVAPDKEIEHTIYNDGGSAARFFYCPKVSRKERHIGHETPPAMFGDVQGCYGPDGKRMAEGFDNRANIETEDKKGNGLDRVCESCGVSILKPQDCDCPTKSWVRPIKTGNNHPTVKPIELMKYLIKLVTPPNGHILDPFNGSGSTGCAAVELGFDYTGIELDPNYVEIATKRISHWEQECKPKTTYNNLFEEY
jgi:DNA modification methylase